MPSIHIPSRDTRTWAQYNRGPYSGPLFSTFNVDVATIPGEIRPSRYGFAELYSSFTSATFTKPFASVRSSADGTSRQWIGANGYLYRGSSSFGSIVVDSHTNTPTTGVNSNLSDMVDFNGALIVSLSTGNLARLSGSTTWAPTWWTSGLSQTAMTSSVPHPMNVGFNKLLVIGDDRYIHTVNTSSVPEYRKVVLPQDQRINTIRSGTDRYWIGTYNTREGRGAIYEWDGFSPGFNREYIIDSDAVMGIILKDNIPYAISASGVILVLGPSGFKEFARFPIANIDGYRMDFDPVNTSPDIHRNGLAIKDGDIHILMNGWVDDVFFFPEHWAGVWRLTGNSLTHTQSLMDPRRTYMSGCRVADYVGVLRTIPNTSGFAYDNLIAGYTPTYLDYAASYSYLCADTYSGTNKRSWFITPVILSSEVDESWKHVWLKQMNITAQGIKVKYRTTESPTGMMETALNPLDDQITWTGAGAFTGGTNSVSVGDEVVIMSGAGAGRSSHVVSKPGTSQYILEDNINEGQTDLAQAYYTTFKKIAYNTNAYSSNIYTIDKPGEWIQLKVEMIPISNTKGYWQPGIQELQLVSAPHQQSDQP